MKTVETKGFTIVELIIVIAIMAIVASMGTLAIQRYSKNSNLRVAARQVMADIATTKARAVAKIDTTYTMTFTATSYTAYTSVAFQGTSVITRQLSDFGYGIRFNPVPADLTFLTRGTISSTSSDIILTNDRGSNADITFNQTGKTYVKFNMQ